MLFEHYTLIPNLNIWQTQLRFLFEKACMQLRIVVLSPFKLNQRPLTLGSQAYPEGEVKLSDSTRSHLFLNANVYLC